MSILLVTTFFNGIILCVYWSSRSYNIYKCGIFTLKTCGCCNVSMRTKKRLYLALCVQVGQCTHYTRIIKSDSLSVGWTNRNTSKQMRLARYTIHLFSVDVNVSLWVLRSLIQPIGVGQCCYIVFLFIRHRFCFIHWLRWSFGC